MLERNRRYYARFPEDRERVRALSSASSRGRALPSGDRLTARRCARSATRSG